MCEVLEEEIFVGPPIRLHTVRLTKDNVRQVAQWMGAIYILSMVDITTNKISVEFRKPAGGTGRVVDYGGIIVKANVGDYIVKRDATVNEYGEKQNDYFYSIHEDDMDAFRKENKE